MIDIPDTIKVDPCPSCGELPVRTPPQVKPLVWQRNGNHWAGGHGYVVRKFGSEHTLTVRIKTITPTPTPTTFFLPADDLRAAFQCISTEQTRYYLGGVFVESDNLVALDGHQMLTIELPDGCHVGTECFTQGMDAPRMPGATGTPQGAGFILSCDATDKAFKAKASGGDLWVYGDTTTGILQFVINHGKGGEMFRVGVLEFTRIDGTYPYWRRVVAKGDGGAASLCYDPAVLGKLIKAADVIDKGRDVRLTGGEDVGDPIRVDFAASVRLRGALMPMRWTGA